jgi:hypothetical protein
MADNDCWGAFGSDSDSEDVDGPTSIDAHNPFEPAADATALSITHHFATSTKSSGVSLKDRVVGIGRSNGGKDGQVSGWREMMAERVVVRGMHVKWTGSAVSCRCDAAILIMENGDPLGCKDLEPSHTKCSLLPGGFLWSIIPLDRTRNETEGSESFLNDYVKDYSESIWDVGSASVVHSSTAFLVVSIQKRSCVINSWSCKWMDKQQKIWGRLSTLNNYGDFPIHENETYLQYERNVACAVTISPSVAERERGKIDATSSSEEHVSVAVLSDTNVRRATEILQKHGLLVIKGLLPSCQTVPWGDAVLADFNSAVSRLRQHPTRPVDLMNPHTADASEENAFEPLSYREMAMREDLRVDLRSGPEMERLRRSQNDLSSRSGSNEKRVDIAKNDLDHGPSIVCADITGTVASWRFHPSILAIIKSVFNPKKDSLFKGNFGRWNFGGAGPDGSPQPFRLGQIGSVLSCPGSGDQAIHADTPHLFEHTDCLPCHYLNIFTPGYDIVNESVNDCFRNEFDDGIWTGNSTMGGTAFVHGSHKLSVSAQLLSEDDEEHMITDENYGTDAAMIRKKLLQLRTLRPALDAGDVLFFDCRTIHYGLSNTSLGDKTGQDINAGRRPMLYLNVTQSWFHDPKNWDDRERIFD